MSRMHSVISGSAVVALALAFTTAMAETPPVEAGYVPTPQELQTIGDRTTGFSVAAVRSLKAVGINSPWQLIQRVKPLVGDTPSIAETIRGVRSALATIQPVFPAAVLPELERHVLGYYGIRHLSL